MPSLLSTTVAANYGRMTNQQTYGVGQAFTQFATRQLRMIKVIAVGSDGSTAVDFTDASATANSDFSKSVRALQTCAEVYTIFTPGTAGFLALVAEDTINDATANTRATQAVSSALTYAVLEAVILASLAKGGSSAVTVTAVDVNSTGIAIANVA
jgi:hypothetical protein